MGKRTASVVLILEECEAGLGRFMGCIMAIVLIMGLCGPVAVRAEVVLEARSIAAQWKSRECRLQRLL